MRIGLSLVAAFAIASAARAESRVILVEARGSPALPALASQVSLHASATVDVQRADVDPLTYAEAASQLVASGAATLVVWIAPVDGGYLVFVAGRTTGRALTELVRIDAAVGTSETERTIALKIAGLLDAVGTPAPVHVVLDAPIVVRPQAREWRVTVDGAIAVEAHERGADGRAGASASHVWRAGAWELGAAFGGYWQPSGTIDRRAGRASIVEIGAVAAGEAARELGPIELVGRPRFVLAALTARGVSADGRSGTARVIAPYGGLEVGARLRVGTARLEVRAGCDLAILHRTLVIDDVTIVDLGAARLHVGLAMTVSL